MQWVVTTGDTVEEAKERALDALGIDEDDLEYEVVAEPSSSLFGLRTTEARVRARIRPTRPRPKLDRRSRRSGPGKRRTKRTKRAPKAAPTDAPTDPPAGDAPAGVPAAAGTSAPDVPAAERTAEAATAAAGPAPQRPNKQKQTSPAGTKGAPMSDIALSEQEPTAIAFVEGLVEAFGAEATVRAEHVDDDDAIEILVEGDDLGLLVGPRGNTLASIAELTRTAVAQQHSGRLEGRLRVDVGGYRARRKEALVRFVGQVADKVLDTGSAVALEPMSPPDRKIVHDAVNDIDGVHTSSRGEDRRRHVVIHPDD